MLAGAPAPSPAFLQPARVNPAVLSPLQRKLTGAAEGLFSASGAPAASSGETLKAIAEALTNTGMGGESGNRIAKMILEGENRENAARMEDIARFVLENFMLKNADDPRVSQMRRLNNEFPGIKPDAGLGGKLAAYAMWTALVAPNRPWDIKALEDFADRVGSARYTYDAKINLKYLHDIWGNIHYGFIGKAAGFSRAELVSGGGIAQIATIFSAALNREDTGPLNDAIGRVTRSELEDVFSAIDDPKDKAAVELGIKLWGAYGTGLTFDTFLQQIRANVDTLNITRE